MNKEVFKDIPGYEGFYQVTESGTVKSLKRKGNKNDKILKLAENSCGEKIVNFSKDKKSRVIKVEELIKLTFNN